MSHWTKEVEPLEKIHNNTFHGNLPLTKRKYDIVIIGGGLMGASLAWFLSTYSDKQKSILIIERNKELASGATGMNGGHLWPSIMDSPQSLLCGRLNSMLGSHKKALEQLKFIYDLGDSAYDELVQLLRENNSCDLDFYNGKGLYIATDKDSMRQLEHDTCLLKDTLKLSKVPELLHKTEIEKLGIKCSGLIGGSLEDRACQLSPVKLVHLLISLTQQLNDRISLLLEASVVKVERLENSNLSIEIDSGEYIACHDVFHCTNDSDSGSSLLPTWLQKKLKTVAGHLISISHPSFSTNLPYGITTSDLFYSVYLPKDNSYVIGHHMTENNKCIGKCWTEYMKLLNIDPALSTCQIVKQEWIGNTGTSTDNLPVVGLLPGSHASSGLGMVHIWGIAKLLAQAMIRQNDDIIPLCIHPKRFNN